MRSAGDFDYHPTVGARRVVEAPLVHADAANLAPFGALVSDPEAQAIEIVRWPAQGWRKIDENSGDQGGLAEGRFEVAWRGDTLYGANHAVDGAYLFGWSEPPERAAAEGPTRPRRQALIWRANYHPDGGQMVFPLNREAFIVGLAPPGDGITPEAFTAFLIDGGHGLYIAPGVWHTAFAPVADEAVFLDRQGRVHARVSVDFPAEFDAYLGLPLV